jgi:hypothetical protein
MNQLAIAVAIIMFPGVIAAVICDKIIVHQPKWNHFKFGIYSFILGVTCYISLQGLNFILDFIFSKYFCFPKVVWSQLEIWGFISDSKTKLKILEVFQATLLAIPIAYFASWVVNFKIFNKISQRLYISNKYGDENLFSFYLNAKEVGWVYIRDIENNLTYQGQVVSYSENDKIQEIVLSNVTVFSYSESEEYYSVPSIYLCKNMGSFIIETIPLELLEEENEQQTTEAIE